MAYQQRGRLLVPIKTQVIPIGDLGLPIGGVEGLQFPEDLPPVLAVNAGQTAIGPRILHLPPSGYIGAQPPTTTQLQNSVVMTASAQVALPDLSYQTDILIYITVASASGTSPTCLPVLQFSPDSGATWLNLANGSAQLTTTGQTGLFTAGIGSSTVVFNGPTSSGFFSGPLPPLCRLRYSISGTTPSFTVSSYLVSR